MGGKLRKNSGFLDNEEIPDPMHYVANMADAMLVLACGLMAALILFWKVDLSNSSSVVTEEKMEKIEVSEVEQKEGDVVLDGYQTKVVYEDPETGDLYMIDN